MKDYASTIVCPIDICAYLHQNLEAESSSMQSMECDYCCCTNPISRRCHKCGGSYCVRHITLSGTRNICDNCVHEKYIRIRNTFKMSIFLTIVCFVAIIIFWSLASLGVYTNIFFPFAGISLVFLLISLDILLVTGAMILGAMCRSQH